MKVYAYIRVSGRGQLAGDGPDRQRDAIKVFCDSHGLTCVEEFFEKGVSGTVEGMDRPAFAELIARSEADGVAAVVVENMDRVARDLIVSEMLLKECRERGIKLYSADQGFLIDMATNSDDPSRKLIRQVLGAMSEYIKSQLVNKLRHARERVREQRGWCEGPKPYGFQAGEQAVLDAIIVLRRQGQSYQEIAEYLNDSGVANRAGRPWSREHIYRTLKSYRKRKVTH